MQKVEIVTGEVAEVKFIDSAGCEKAGEVTNVIAVGEVTNIVAAGSGRQIFGFGYAVVLPARKEIKNNVATVFCVSGGSKHKLRLACVFDGVPLRRGPALAVDNLSVLDKPRFVSKRHRMFLADANCAAGTMPQLSNDKERFLSAFNEDLPEWLLTQPVAHRGLHNNSAGLPENSLASIAACVRAGCPVEIDVRLLADGNVIVFHDRTMDRLTNCHGPIEHLEMNSVQGATLLGTSEHIPLLSEALAAIDGRVPLLLEIKCEMLPVSPISEAVAREMKHYNGPYVVQSFNPFVLRSMRRLLPGISLGLLSGWKIGTLFLWLSKADVLCQEVSSLEDASVQRARQRGLPVLAWVVRDEQTLSKAVRLADNYIYESIKLAKLERSSVS